MQFVRVGQFRHCLLRRLCNSSLRKEGKEQKETKTVVIIFVSWAIVRIK